ncbi:hypothetical protein CNYM01_05262 [Colletotrichum nymphaeae SA-01]|uniref:Uncharacterized protein n=1 Tax=Colletotrichum nymphaeae SA-01 TaxID=1460502 RepID=A0A135RRL4_9PEZI|nr:hypothetical protein CNYM01_05262 [Colletotrichum nymphaeae SA-01]
MSGSTSSPRRNDKAKYEALDKGPQSGIELGGNVHQSRGVDVSSKRNTLMEQMRLLRTSRDEQGDLTSDALYYGQDGKTRRSPQFGSLSNCNVDDGTEEKLWSIEARRLLDGLESSQNFVRAVSTPIIPGGVMSSGFIQLEHFADRLLCILAVYGLHDQNALLELERSRKSQIISQDVAIVSHSRRFLENRLRHTKLAGVHNSTGENQGSKSTYDKDAIMGAKSILHVLDSELPEFCAMIDCITVTVARIVSLTPDQASISRLGSFWHTITLSLLAKISAKMKVLGHNLPGYVAAALHDTRDLRGPYSRRQTLETPDWRDGERARRRYPIPLSVPSAGPKFDTYFDQVEISALPALHAAVRPEILKSPTDTYESNMTKTSALLFRLLWRILTDLRTRNTRGHNQDEFDISAVIYPTEVKGVSATIYQDRQAQITGSSSSVAASICATALNMLLDLTVSCTESSISNIVERDRHFASENAGPRLKIAVLSFSGKEDFDYPISSMDELIRIMIPLSCMDPIISDAVFQTRVAVSETNLVAKVPRVAGGYSARVSLRHVISRTSTRYQGKALSQSLFFERKGTNSDPPLQHRWMYLPWLASPTHVAQSSSHLLSTSWENAKHWEIEESAITIPCLRYTLSIMASCFLLVLGGLLSGFLVGERITGVDPFNLTMFSWIIAGFIVLVAKSIRVKDWPWRDFLRGRVTCRSVREIVSVTGLDAQDILVFLLSSEVRTPLRSRGPFNSVFTFIDDGRDDSRGSHNWRWPCIVSHNNCFTVKIKRFGV